MPQIDNGEMNLTQAGNARLFGRIRVSIVALQESNSQRTNRCGCHNSAKPIMPLQSGIDSTADATDPNKQRGQHTTDALYKDKGVDASLFVAPSLSFDLCLLKDPIYTIRANGMQTLYACNRQQVGIRMVVLDNHLRAATTFNVSGGLPTHALAVCVSRAQQSQSRRATCVRLSKTPCGQRGIGEAQGVVPVRSLHRKANSLDVSYCVFCH